MELLGPYFARKILLQSEFKEEIPNFISDYVKIFQDIPEFFEKTTISKELKAANDGFSASISFYGSYLGIRIEIRKAEKRQGGDFMYKKRFLFDADTSSDFVSTHPDSIDFLLVYLTRIHTLENAIFEKSINHIKNVAIM